MADLLAEAKRRDAELEKIAKNAAPAGEADPYIKPKASEE
jgi:ribosome-binding factor A